jgi:FkbM family methyltransferase
MSLKRRLINTFDTPAGRWLLAEATSRRASRLLGRPTSVRYQGVWTHRVGDDYIIPDSPRYNYYDSEILRWGDELKALAAAAKDYWFTSYSPKPGDVIVDIGAGRGEDTLFFSQAVGPSGKVVAVEAHPLSFQLLQRFCELNGLANVIPVHAAVMDAPGSVLIDTNEEWESNTVSQSGEGVEVAAVTIDALCSKQKIGHIHFLKMNIEGAERYALPGMSEMLRHTDQLCICCHDFRADRGDGEQYRSREFVEKLLSDAGFRVTRNASAPEDFLRDHVHAQRLAGGSSR